MVSVAGASQYYNASRLANSPLHMAAQSPTLLGASETINILDAAKGVLSQKGIGISGRARSMNAQLLNNTADINKLLSLGAGADASIPGAQTIIKSLMAKYGYKGSLVDAAAQASLAAKVAAADNGSAAASSTGTTVNKTA